MVKENTEERERRKDLNKLYFSLAAGCIMLAIIIIIAILKIGEFYA